MKKGEHRLYVTGELAESRKSSHIALPSDTLDQMHSIPLGHLKSEQATKWYCLRDTK